jgi:hypothetical protein
MVGRRERKDFSVLAAPLRRAGWQACGGWLFVFFVSGGIAGVEAAKTERGLARPRHDFPPGQQTGTGSKFAMIDQGRRSCR